MLKKEEVKELLKNGATIEFTVWGLNYPVYVRLNELFERINRNTYKAIKDSLVLKKHDGLSYTYVLKK